MACSDMTPLAVIPGKRKTDIALQEATAAVRRGETVTYPWPHSTPGHEPQQRQGKVRKVYPDNSVEIEGSPSIWPVTRYKKG
ncbi:hypothetical protein PXK56_18220 [Phaeobacter gallaeciensis]|uniref:hypothetical protein n=1 Tax=Phaeobacter gallaeciensis TaxID=60890 RepID=UPI0023804A79|nr:hypothetical protein [Phaeobacter gallaeciensis]MDE4297123.1 hypothetical protein [Phaeobacter gallaeciensis]